MKNFTIKQVNNFCIIHAPEDLNTVSSQEFCDSINNLAMSGANCYIFEFSKTNILDRCFYKVLLQFKSLLKENSKHLFSINMSNHLIKQIKQDGLYTNFSTTSSVDEAYKQYLDLTSRSKSLDQDFIRPFIGGIKKAFEIQCNTPISLSNAYFKSKPMEDIHIASALTLKSEKFSGRLILSFTEKSFLKVYGNMFEEEPEKITDEMLDAAAEILNIIYGNAKTDLNKNGYDFPRSLPALLNAADLQSKINENNKSVVVPILLANEMAYLEIESKMQ